MKNIKKLIIFRLALSISFLMISTTKGLKSKETNSQSYTSSYIGNINSVISSNNSGAVEGT